MRLCEDGFHVKSAFLQHDANVFISAAVNQPQVVIQGTAVSLLPHSHFSPRHPRLLRGFRPLILTLCVYATHPGLCAK